MFSQLGGLRAMFTLAKQSLGVPPHFKSGKHSNSGPVRPTGSKLMRKATSGKLAGVGRGY
jgi:hypothetical protein